MGLFDFQRNRTRMHTQIRAGGHIRDIGKIKERDVKRNSIILFSSILFLLFTLFFFGWENIPTRPKIFLVIVFLLVAFLDYHFIRRFYKLKRKSKRKKRR